MAWLTRHFSQEFYLSCLPLAPPKDFKFPMFSSELWQGKIFCGTALMISGKNFNHYVMVPNLDLTGIEVQDVKPEAGDLLKWDSSDCLFSLWEAKCVEHQINAEWLIRVLSVASFLSCSFCENESIWSFWFPGHIQSNSWTWTWKRILGSLMCKTRRRVASGRGWYRCSNWHWNSALFFKLSLMLGYSWWQDYC